MKKYFIHIAYLLVIAFFAVFAKIKANEAEKQHILAMKNASLAEEQAAHAAQAEARARQALQEAERQKNAALDALNNCEGK